MKFIVPQFLDIKSKIFGPLTLKQFLYLAGGAGCSALVWFSIPSPAIALMIIVPVVALALALAFYKVHDRPFIKVLESAFYYLIGSKLFIWQRIQRSQEERSTNATHGDDQVKEDIPAIPHSKLKKLTWSLDVSSGARGSDDKDEE